SSGFYWFSVLFFFLSAVHPPYLHSFPTRRSSDLHPRATGRPRASDLQVLDGAREGGRPARRRGGGVREPDAAQLTDRARPLPRDPARAHDRSGGAGGGRRRRPAVRRGARALGARADHRPDALRGRAALFHEGPAGGRVL